MKSSGIMVDKLIIPFNPQTDKGYSYKLMGHNESWTKKCQLTCMSSYSRLNCAYIQPLTQRFRVEMSFGQSSQRG